MSAISKIIPVLGLIVISMLFMTYTTGILDATDDSVDMTGSDFEDQYNKGVEVQKGTLALFSPISMILGVVMLLLAVAAVRTVRI